MTTMTAYQSLLVDYTPRPIRSDRAYKRALRQMEKLMKSRLSRAERELSQVLGTLIMQYESEHYPTPDVSPAEMLAFLIDARGVIKADVAHETGIPRSTITHILAGRRNISTANIAKLADYFNVSPSVFIPSLEKLPARRGVQ